MYINDLLNLRTNQCTVGRRDMANISSYAQSFHTSLKREGLLEKVVEQSA